MGVESGFLLHFWNRCQPTEMSHVFALDRMLCAFLGHQRDA